MPKKIRGGKLVDRTTEEQVAFEAHKAEYYANVNQVKFKKRAKLKERFMAVTLRQADKLNNAGLMTKAMGVFLIMLDKNYQRQGPFPVPTKDLDALKIDRRAQTRAITALEEGGLISVVRKHKKLPIITVL
jgi:hypothetical protein